jgi:putative lipoic acid-binding regulatory protein
VRDEAVLGFPCFYTFKVFGRHRDGFCERVREVIADRVGRVPLDSVKVRESAHGKYVCISVVTQLRSRGQLEQIYADLHDQDEVLLCL